MYTLERDVFPSTLSSRNIISIRSPSLRAKRTASKMPVDSSSVLLHAAVLESNESAVRFLLKHGADPNAVSRTSCDCLHELGSQTADASFELHEVLSRYRSSSLGASCTFAPNPLAMASGPSYAFSGRTRAKRHQQQHSQSKALTPLQVAAATGHSAILDLLIAYGGDVECALDGDYTPLVIAVMYQHYEIAETLVKQGVNVNTRSRIGKTPLYLAVKTKKPAMVSLLLEKGADPNLATDNGVTPLHIAVERKLDDVVELLLKYGADVNVATKTGVTPLHCAAVKGQTDITEMILRHGGDVSVIMKKGEIDVTPLLWVTEAEKGRIMNVLAKYAPKVKRSGVYGTFFKKIWKQIRLKNC